MSEFYDLDKEETLYNYIIGTLTTIKARENGIKKHKDIYLRIESQTFCIRFDGQVEINVKLLIVIQRNSSLTLKFITLEKINLGEKLSGVMTLRTFSMNLTWRFWIYPGIQDRTKKNEVYVTIFVISRTMYIVLWKHTVKRLPGGRLENKKIS